MSAHDLEAKLVDALERLHCGGLAVGSSDFSAEIWKKDLERAGRVLVLSSRKKAGIEPPDLLGELKKLHAICLRMDDEVEAKRPSEEEYMAAIQSSAKAIFRAEGA